jgi:hypothetical protein
VLSNFYTNAAMILEGKVRQLEVSGPGVAGKVA